MQLTSFPFLSFLAILFAAYRFVGARFRWPLLLAASAVFFCAGSSPFLLALPLLSAASAYAATAIDERQRAQGKSGNPVVGAAIAFNVLLWFAFKGGGYWRPLLPESVRPALPAALGMSYYVMQVIAYILDCHWESVRRERNFLKLFLFVIFFPVSPVEILNSFVSHATPDVVAPCVVVCFG